MTSPAARTEITPGDRLGFTLCLATIVHAMLILGVGFTPEPDANPPDSNMEVILIHRSTQTQPDEATMLAQQDSEGGGVETVSERGGTPADALLPLDTQTTPLTPPGATSAVGAAPEPPATEQTPGEAESAAARPVLAARSTEVAQVTPPSDRPVADARPPETQTEERELPSAAELMTSSFALSSLSTELDRRLAAQAERPRSKYISASTREYRYAAYMESWRTKVERIGNLNYPEEARRRGLSASLVLTVALLPDGSVDEITVRRPSGFAVLDEAAIRIVNLAAPFAPFPASIRDEVDVLYVTRTWRFVDSVGMETE